MATQLSLPHVSQTGSLRHSLDWLLGNALCCRYWTRDMHARNARYLLEHFGDRELTDVGYAEIKAYLDYERRRGLSTETIRKRLSTLHMAMSEAVRMRRLAEVPPWPVMKSDSRPKDAFWTLAQWQSVHAIADDEDLRTWIACGFWTGMHTSDINRFRWQDVDLIRNTWVRRNTKTGAKPIELPLPRQIGGFLRARNQELSPHPRDLISARNLGNPNRAIKALAKRAGVPEISPIGLRHSCVTYLEECGTTELFQVTWMGLKSPVMLKKHYMHITRPTLDGGIAALDARAA